MISQWRLDSKGRNLADAFRNARPEQRRRAGLVACETAIELVGLDRDDDVSVGLDALRAGRTVGAELRERLRALSTRYDDQYFELDEADGPGKKLEALHLFAKARAAAALSFALSEDVTELHESIYEAMSALIDNPSADPGPALVSARANTICGQFWRSKSGSVRRCRLRAPPARRRVRS
jgi:hypothetical protein